jgi:hypothetical protein
MNLAHGVCALAVALICIISPVAGAEYLYIKDVTMHLNEGDATFDVNYTLETFTKLYVLALGCKYIEPDLLSIFSNYSSVKVIRAGPDGASLLARGAGKYNSGYYLFDSRPFGFGNKQLLERIDKFTVVYPEGRARTFFNVTSTQNVFCEAKNASKTEIKIA